LFTIFEKENFEMDDIPSPKRQKLETKDSKNTEPTSENNEKVATEPNSSRQDEQFIKLSYLEEYKQVMLDDAVSYGIK
jgi:hypothetical protein